MSRSGTAALLIGLLLVVNISPIPSRAQGVPPGMLGLGDVTRSGGPNPFGYGLSINNPWGASPMVPYAGAYGYTTAPYGYIPYYGGTYNGWLGPSGFPQRGALNPAGGFQSPARIWPNVLPGRRR